MIFTPEESREIAEEMLKWDRIPGYAHDVWHECWFDSAGRFVSVSLPDFSLPEWQIKIQEKVRKLALENKPWTYHLANACFLDSQGIPHASAHLMNDDDITQTPAWMIQATGANLDDACRIVQEDALLWLAERKVKHE